MGVSHLFVMVKAETLNQASSAIIIMLYVTANPSADYYSKIRTAGS